MYLVRVRVRVRVRNRVRVRLRLRVRVTRVRLRGRVSVRRRRQRVPCGAAAAPADRVYGRALARVDHRTAVEAGALRGSAHPRDEWEHVDRRGRHLVRVRVLGF